MKIALVTWALPWKSRAWGEAAVRTRSERCLVRPPSEEEGDTPQEKYRNHRRKPILLSWQSPVSNKVSQTKTVK